MKRYCYNNYMGKDTGKLCFLIMERRLYCLIKLYIDSIKNDFILEHDACCKEHVADELVKVLDIIIADYEIKSSPKKNSLPNKDKEKILLDKRSEYLEMISQKECSCKDYLFTSDNHIREN